jgi:hypothetical protein
VVTYLSKDSSTHNPKNTTPSVSRADEPETTQALVGEWIDLCRKRPPKNVIGQTSKAIKGMLEEGIAPQDIRNGIGPWVEKGLHPSALPSVVNEVMNSSPRAVARRTASRPPTTDTRCEDIQALKGQFTASNSPFLLALPKGA